MAKMKYITFENLGIVIFDEAINHKEMAAWLRDKPISAGFVFLPNRDTKGNEVHCFGKSTSLNLESSEKVVLLIVDTIITSLICLIAYRLLRD